MAKQRSPNYVSFPTLAEDAYCWVKLDIAGKPGFYYREKSTRILEIENPPPFDSWGEPFGATGGVWCTIGFIIFRGGEWVLFVAISPEQMALCIRGVGGTGFSDGKAAVLCESLHSTPRLLTRSPPQSLILLSLIKRYFALNLGGRRTRRVRFSDVLSLGGLPLWSLGAPRCVEY